jgi:hypothetical protein
MAIHGRIAFWHFAHARFPTTFYPFPCLPPSTDGMHWATEDTTTNHHRMHRRTDTTYFVGWDLAF